MIPVLVVAHIILLILTALGFFIGTADEFMSFFIVLCLTTWIQVANDTEPDHQICYITGPLLLGLLQVLKLLNNLTPLVL